MNYISTIIDLHCHLIPNVDDGPQTIEDSIELAKQLEKSGFTDVFATSHVMDGFGYLSPERILSELDILNEAYRDNNIKIKVHPGSENYIFPELCEWIKKNKLITLGGINKYILIELPLNEIPVYTNQVLFELKIMGITPIIAHPERYLKVSEELSILNSWKDFGALFQLNLKSLSGKYGSKVRDTAFSILENNFYQFIGTDAHNTSELTNPYEKELKILEEMTSSEYFKNLISFNPQKVIEGIQIDVDLNKKIANHKLRKNKQNFIEILSKSIKTYFRRKTWKKKLIYRLFGNL